MNGGNMSKGICIGLALMGLVASCPSYAGDWYVIQNMDNKCAKEEGGPAEFIRTLQELKAPYRTTDTTRAGKVVKTVVIDKDASIAVTFYRSNGECLAAQREKKSRQIRELEKYR
jgi:hypothetical protein